MVFLTCFLKVKTRVIFKIDMSVSKNILATYIREVTSHFLWISRYFCISSGPNIRVMFMMSPVFLALMVPMHCCIQLHRWPPFHLFHRAWNCTEQTDTHLHYGHSYYISLLSSTWHSRQSNILQDSVSAQLDCNPCSKQDSFDNDSWRCRIKICSLPRCFGLGFFVWLVFLICCFFHFFSSQPQCCFLQNSGSYLFCGKSSCFMQKFAFTAISWARVKSVRFLAAAISSSNVITVLGGLAAETNKINSSQIPIVDKCNWKY